MYVQVQLGAPRETWQEEVHHREVVEGPGQKKQRVFDLVILPLPARF